MRVVVESHPINDDYGYVPSEEEFEKLCESVRDLERKCTSVGECSKEVERRLQNVVELLDKQKVLISALSDKIVALKGDMSKELTSGDWRKLLEQFVASCIKDLEEKTGLIESNAVNKSSELIAVLSQARLQEGELKRVKSDAVSEFDAIAKQTVDAIDTKSKLIGRQLAMAQEQTEAVSQSAKDSEKLLYAVQDKAKATLEQLEHSRVSFLDNMKKAEAAVAAVSQRREQEEMACVASSNGMRFAKVSLAIGIVSLLFSICTISLLAWKFLH